MVQIYMPYVYFRFTHTHTYTHMLVLVVDVMVVQLFRADLISAMKLPDSTPMESGSFLTIKEPWRTEWEKGVQVRHITVAAIL